jgi:pSer/pThr/pTyr-binding forkhead associated (FHA) protein
LLHEYTLQLRDLGSKNGTPVNGCRVGTSAIILLHNDTVSIGEVTLLIDLTSETKPNGSPPKVEIVFDPVGQGCLPRRRLDPSRWCCDPSANDFETGLTERFSPGS